jgi:amino acid adenylation domain-containing protein
VTQPPPRRSVWQSVGEQARRTPDAVALRFRDQAFSYRELQERADRLAARLCATGIGPGDVVGVCLPRHPDLVTALLAVQQSGAAYLPLDPEYPAARIEYCLHDAAAKAVVTHSAVTGSLPATMATITLDTLADEVTQAAPRSDFDAEAPAYLIYTSGSTGKPKGVVISHGALAQFLQGISTVTPLSATDTLLAVTTPAFDIAGLELYLPLLNGAVLALADGDSQRDPELLKAALEDTGATVMQATPATWRLLLATGWRAPSRFRALIGGEALPRELARQLLDSGVRLFNLYGPTEATIWATSAPIESTDDGIPLGRPLPNTVLRVLDDAGSLCPIGVEGELHIGGAQLAAGYHDRPELTADRFVQHREFGRVRFDQAGHLHFLGRTDFQIKLRGFRIELGDIESTLEAHAAISQAVACVHTFKEGDVRLVAYLVHRPATQSSVAELRQHVLQHLPAYMCPQHFVSLEQMPLTPNGKVDRKALPPPWHPTAAEAPAEAPASDTERMLASLWQQMLGRYPNRHDDFFAAGGHSLTAVRMIGRISQSFGVRIPLNEILETPTVAALAEHIEVIRGLQLQEERAADDIAEREEIVL